MKEELESIRALRAAAAERFGTEDIEMLLSALRADKEQKNVPTEAVHAPISPIPTERADAKELARAREEACRDLLAHIRARGLRPAENGTSNLPQTGVGAGGGMTKAERAELARRAARGEQISF